MLKNKPIYIEINEDNREIPIEINNEDYEIPIEAETHSAAIDINIDGSIKEIDIFGLTGVAVKNGHSPFVNEETGTWWEYDDSISAYVDTHISAFASVRSLSNEEIYDLFNKYN